MFFFIVLAPGPKTTKKNTNSTPNKSQTQCARAYGVTLFLSTDCQLSTETCSRFLYSLGLWLNSVSADTHLLNDSRVVDDRTKRRVVG